MDRLDHVSRAKRLVRRLPRQERQFLKGMVEGCSQAQLATCLDLSSSQAAEMKQAIVKKLQAGSNADLVRIGIYARL